MNYEYLQWIFKKIKALKYKLKSNKFKTFFGGRGGGRIEFLKIHINFQINKIYKNLKQNVIQRL